jgi:hypothetical protein
LSGFKITASSCLLIELINVTLYRDDLALQMQNIASRQTSELPEDKGLIVGIPCYPGCECGVSIPDGSKLDIIIF